MCLYKLLFIVIIKQDITIFFKRHQKSKKHIEKWNQFNNI